MVQMGCFAITYKMFISESRDITDQFIDNLKLETLHKNIVPCLCSVT